MSDEIRRADIDALADEKLATDLAMPTGESSGEGPKHEAVPVRRFISDTIIFGFVSVFDRAIGFILLPLTTYLMSPSEYGVLSLFQTTTELLQYLIALGVFSAFFRFYLEVKDPDARNKILNAAFWQVSAVALAASLIFLPFVGSWNEWLFESRGIIFPLMIVPTTYLGVLISLGDCRLQADGRALSFLGVNMVHTVTMRGLSLALLFIGWGASGWIVGLFAGQCITTTVFFFIAFGGLSRSLDMASAKKLFLFGLPLVPLAISHWAMQGSGKYVINAMLENPLEQNGLYGVGERISQIMAMMNLAFALGWRKFAFSNIHHADGPRLLGQGATLFFAVAGFAALGLIALGDDLTRWMIGEEYWAGIVVIPYLTMASFFWGMTEVLAISLYKVDRPKLLSTAYVSAAVLCVVLNFILVPQFGIVGAAQSWMIAELFKVLMVWGVGQRLFPIDIQYGRCALAVAVYIPLLTVCMIFFPQTTVATTLIQFAIVMAAPVLLYILGFVRPSEREMIGHEIEKLLAKVRRTPVT